MTDHTAAAFAAAALYRREVLAGIVQSLTEAVESKEVTTEDALNERIDEEADSNAAVIYTGNARVYLLASPNFEAYCSEGVDDDGPSVQAFFALRADLDESTAVGSLFRSLEG